MQDKSGNREPIDRFSQYMQERLNDHRMEVDTAVWEAIDARMRQRKRVRMLSLGGLLAAALLGGLLWMIVPDAERLYEENNLVKVEEVAAEPEPDTYIHKEEQSSGQKKEVEKTSRPLLGAVRQMLAPEEPKPEEPEEVMKPEEKPAEEAVEVPEEKTPEAVREEKTRPVRPVRRNGSEMKPSLPKKRGSWLVSAGFASGGNLDLSLGGGDYPIYDQDSSPGNGGQVKPPQPPFTSLERPEPEDFTDTDYSVPLSFGITVRKAITPLWAVETGLIYSYLSTNLSGANKISTTGKMEVHYLGIPVNLVANLWSDSRWSVYVSGGFMVEKGIQTVFTTKVYTNSKIETTKKVDSANGLQYSLNGALGIGYRFYENWSFYAEPKIYYYFDTDQPLSIRTEHPSGVGISAGLRYQF